MRKPKPIKIRHLGQEVLLHPCSVGLKEVERVRDQLNTAIKYMKLQKKKTKASKNK